MAAGLGGLASGLYGLFGAQDPQDGAWPYLNKLSGMFNSTYSPWVNAGQNALSGMNQYQYRGDQAGNELMDQYGQMINNPSGLINRLGSGFQQSPGYAFQTSQALDAANRAAAAGGMAGSPEEQQQIAGVTNQLANQDYYNYLNHSQSLYGQGIQGLQGTESMGLNAGEDVYNQGAAAAHDLAQSLGSTYMTQANLGYQGIINHNNRVGGAIGSLASFFDPGGAYLGGGSGGGQGGGSGMSNPYAGGQSNMGSDAGNYDRGANNDSGQLPAPFSDDADNGSGGNSGSRSSGMNMSSLAGLAALFF